MATIGAEVTEREINIENDIATVPYVRHQGMAWAYRKYLPDRTLLDVEAAARASKRGIWTDPDPIAPWEWRAARRSGACARNAADLAEPRALER